MDKLPCSNIALAVFLRRFSAGVHAGIALLFTMIDTGKLKLYKWPSSAVKMQEHRDSFAHEA